MKQAFIHTRIYTYANTQHGEQRFHTQLYTLNDADSKLVSTSFRLKPLTQTLTHMQKKK